ncbi:MAG: hypothetical protein KKA42_08230 [candidate division Zixibacteria bacterium]|nr:hypothetical protein [candidate division Zixibacteria bacterium]
MNTVETRPFPAVSRKSSNEVGETLTWTEWLVIGMCGVFALVGLWCVYGAIEQAKNVPVAAWGILLFLGGALGVHKAMRDRGGKNRNDRK